MRTKSAEPTLGSLESDLGKIARERGTSARRTPKKVDPSVYKHDESHSLIEKGTEKNVEVIETEIVDKDVVHSYRSITVKICGHERKIRVAPRFGSRIKKGDRVNVKYVKSKSRGLSYGEEITHHIPTKKAVKKAAKKKRSRKS